MGLAASQARFLSLTARSSDLNYEAQQISQQRLALATESNTIAQEYSEKMSNTIMFANTPDGNKQVLTYEVITSQDPFKGLGLRIVDLDGNVVVPSRMSAIEVTQKNEDGLSETVSITSTKDFLDAYMTDLSEADYQNLSTYSLEEIADYYKKNYSDSGISIKYIAGRNPDLKNEDEHYLFDEQCTDSEYLQKMLQSGQWLIQRVDNAEENTWESISWQGYAGISEEMDKSDDAAAEAEYDQRKTELAKKDKELELQLERVQTEIQAVDKEIDAVKETIKDNVEHSYNAMS